MALRFVCADGEHIAKADADCCSHTWIEDISEPGLGFPCTVLAAIDLEMPDDQGNGDDEVIAFYGLKLETDKGEIVIEYRNESNGYYGGSLSWPGDYHYGGVFGQNDSNFLWRELPPN